MAGKVDQINTKVLRQCREQLNYSVEDVAKKVKAISLIESGERKPTFKQLDDLSDLYNVPRWVFISDDLPLEYQYATTDPNFRKFTDSPTESFRDPKVRKLVSRVEQLRLLILELMEDIAEEPISFDPPKLDDDPNASLAAQQIIEWLEIKDPLNFDDLRKILEDKGIFIFLTSKYAGWSKIDEKQFRGLSIYHPILPIIIINDSDNRKAHSFTLFHELGHLVKKESSIDDWKTDENDIEKWCNEVAGNVLMPAPKFQENWKNINDFMAVKKHAKIFKVSPYACLVRLRQLNMIDQITYNRLIATE